MYPEEDLVEHDLDSDECVCGPHVQFEDRGWVVIHHSLDNREASEADAE